MQRELGTAILEGLESPQLDPRRYQEWIRLIGVNARILVVLELVDLIRKKEDFDRLVWQAEHGLCYMPQDAEPEPFPPTDAAPVDV